MVIIICGCLAAMPTPRAARGKPRRSPSGLVAGSLVGPTKPYIMLEGEKPLAPQQAPVPLKYKVGTVLKGTTSWPRPIPRRLDRADPLERDNRGGIRTMPRMSPTSLSTMARYRAASSSNWRRRAITLFVCSRAAMAIRMRHSNP